MCMINPGLEDVRYTLIAVAWTRLRRRKIWLTLRGSRQEDILYRKTLTLAREAEERESILLPFTAPK